MAKTPEEIEKALNVALDSVASLEARVAKLEGKLQGVSDSITHVANNESLSADHVFSPNRKGLREYDEAVNRLKKLKPGETAEIVHLGKKLTVAYDAARELLRQGQIA